MNKMFNEGTLEETLPAGTTLARWFGFSSITLDEQYFENDDRDDLFPGANTPANRHNPNVSGRRAWRVIMPWGDNGDDISVLFDTGSDINLIGLRAHDLMADAVRRTYSRHGRMRGATGGYEDFSESVVLRLPLERAMFPGGTDVRLIKSRRRVIGPRGDDLVFGGYFVQALLDDKLLPDSRSENFISLEDWTIHLLSSTPAATETHGTIYLYVAFGVILGVLGALGLPRLAAQFLRLKSISIVMLEHCTHGATAAAHTLALTSLLSGLLVALISPSAAVEVSPFHVHRLASSWDLFITAAAFFLLIPSDGFQQLGREVLFFDSFLALMSAVALLSSRAWPSIARICAFFFNVAVAIRAMRRTNEKQGNGLKGDTRITSVEVFISMLVAGAFFLQSVLFVASCFSGKNAVLRSLAVLASGLIPASVSIEVLNSLSEYYNVAKNIEDTWIKGNQPEPGAGHDGINEGEDLSGAAAAMVGGSRDGSHESAASESRASSRSRGARVGDIQSE